MGKKSDAVKMRYIGWTEYGKLVDSLVKKVKASRVPFALVIGIARGGIPVAMVIADQLGVKIDMINAKSYTGISKRGRVKIISTLTESIRGKNVLVVDDLVDRGDTLLKIIRHLESYEPGEIQTAVMFEKPWSRKKPDYSLEVVNDWIVFPWERGEVARIKEKG